MDNNNNNNNNNNDDDDDDAPTDFNGCVTYTWQDIKYLFSAARLTRAEIEAANIYITNHCDENLVWNSTNGLHRRGPYPCYTKKSAQHAKAEVLQGLRKQTLVHYTATHCVLIFNHKYPYPGVVASHLCHEPKCCNILHLCWESQRKNEDRNKCKRQNKCICGFDPPCILGVH